jgi:hypothetical protein
MVANSTAACAVAVAALPVKQCAGRLTPRRAAARVSRSALPSDARLINTTIAGGGVTYRVRGAQDLCAGLLFVFFGALALYLARAYPFGTAMRMGPGYFPTILGGILALLGAAILLKGLLVRGPAIGTFALVPLVLILSAVALFAVTVERFGILVAVALAVVVSALPSGQFRWGEVAALLVVMAALAVGLFTYGLGLPFKVFPG